MSPTHTRKGGRLYRYYVSQSVLKRGADACPIGRVPAAEIEAAVIDQLRGMLRPPEIIVGTWRAARPEIDGLTEAEVREALEAARSALGRAVPGRAGADRPAAGRAGRRRARRARDPAPDAGPGACGPGSRRHRRHGAEGGMTDDPADASPSACPLPFASAAAGSWSSRRTARRWPRAARHASTTPWSRRSPGRSGGGRCWRPASIATIEEIAAAEKINASYVSRVLRLTLLAPEDRRGDPRWAAADGDDAGGADDAISCRLVRAEQHALKREQDNRACLSWVAGAIDLRLA